MDHPFYFFYKLSKVKETSNAKRYVIVMKFYKKNTLYRK